MLKSFYYFSLFITHLSVYCAFGRSATEAQAVDCACRCLMLQRYATADSLMLRESLQYPCNLEALYLRCAIWQTRILDYESYTVDADGFLTFADSVATILMKKHNCQRGKDSVAALFYIGSILGGEGVILAKKGTWPRAVRYALRSISYFKQAIVLDSACWAAYYGIGVFNYYLSQNLKWLPFFGDKRAEALRQIRLSTKAAVPFNFAACNSLCWILIERNEFKTADSIVSEALSRYPDNTLFIRIKVRAQLGLRQWERAEIDARRLIELSDRKHPKNWADIVSGYQAVVCSYDNRHLRRQCLDAASSALMLEVPEAFREIPFVKKHFAYIADMKKKYEKTRGNNMR